MLINTRETYGLFAQLLHWATANLILIQIPFGAYMYVLPVGTADEAAYKFWCYSLHKTLGVSALIVAIVRVAWAAIQPCPRPLNSDRKLESLTALTVHWMLYGAIIVMPLTGWAQHSATEGFAPIWWPLPQDLPMVPKNPELASFFGTAHFFTAFLLGLCLILHVAGALKHTLIDRDDTLRRMIPGFYRPRSTRRLASNFLFLPPILAFFSFLILGVVSVVSYSIGPSSLGGNRAAMKPAAASNAGWQVDMEKSRLAIQVVLSGKPVSGSFQSWYAEIIFDPEKLDTSSIEVEVDVASLSLGSVSPQAISTNFLNAKAFPFARFVSRTIGQTGDHSYEARGEFTLAGQTGSLTLPFELTIVNDRAFATGAVSLDRLEFGVGKKGYSGDVLVGVEVLIQVTVEADRAPSS